MIVLAGDVGGTNARLAIVELEGGAARFVHQSRYPSADHAGLAPIVRRFFEEAGSRPDRACFGIACPVVGDDCSAPNLPWTINARALAAEIEIPRTAIINDFVAVGYGIELLRPADLVTLQEGTPEPQGPIALIGAGTGLGQGFLLWQGDHYRVLASEGGHSDFAPSGEVQAGLLRALREQFGRVSWERLLSGPGIAHIYEYLRASGVAPEQPAVRAELDAEDDGKVIVTARARPERLPLGSGARAVLGSPRCAGRQPGAHGAGDRRGVHRGRHRAPDRRAARQQSVSDGVPEQGAAVRRCSRGCRCT